MQSLKFHKPRVITVKYELICEWEDCTETFTNALEFNEHITSHLDNYITSSTLNKKFFNCLWKLCTFQETNEQVFQRHVYFHGYYSGLLEQGKQHLECFPNIPKCMAIERNGHKLPELNNNFTCRWLNCGADFISAIEFYQHIEQHIAFENVIQKSPNKKRQTFVCFWDFCGKKLPNRYRLVEHITTHTGKKHAACYNCGELFRTKTFLFDHLRRQPENNTNDYQCAQCFKYFATEKLLRNHVLKHVNYFKCSMCDMTCNSSSALATHIRYRHIKDRPFQCKHCDACFVRKSDLNKHVALKHNKLTYNCPSLGCKYSVQTQSQMRRHILDVHSNSPVIYGCHCCKKFFKCGRSLSQHLIKMHGFQLPSGHKRFTYRVDEHGIKRLETMRIESLEVTQQIVSPTEQFDTQEIEVLEPRIHMQKPNKKTKKKMMQSKYTDKDLVVIEKRTQNKNDEALAGDFIISLPNVGAL